MTATEDLSDRSLEISEYETRFLEIGMFSTGKHEYCDQDDEYQHSTWPLSVGVLCIREYCTVAVIFHCEGGVAPNKSESFGLNTKEREMNLRNNSNKRPLETNLQRK